MKIIFSYFLLFFSTSIFAFTNGIDLPQSHDLAKFTVIIESDFNSTEPNVHCTGVIISNTQILTLNYCFDKNGMLAKNYWIHFGVDGTKPVEVRRVKSVIPHPLAVLNDYRNTPYDIAIINLDSPVPTGFKPIQISSFLDSELISKLPFDTYLVGAGGESSTSTAELNRLRYVKQAAIVENFFYPLYSIRDSYVFCLDDELDGFDFKDLGGPIVFQENGQYHLIGLVSGWVGTTSVFQVPGTCREHTSVQQVNVTAEWILSQLNP